MGSLFGIQPNYVICGSAYVDTYCIATDCSSSTGAKSPYATWTVMRDSHTNEECSTPYIVHCGC